MKWLRIFLLFSILLICSCIKPNREKEVKEPVEPITFTFYNQDGDGNHWDDPIAKKITEVTGVTIETDYPVGGDTKRVTRMIASNSYPDIIFAKEQASELIEADALIDLSELIEQYGPNIKKLYGDMYERLRFSKDDPSIYQLCSEPYKADNCVISGDAKLQYAVLQEHGFRIPKDLNEYEQYIKEYMEKYPQIYGKDTIGLTLSCYDWHWYITLSNPSGFIANGAKDNGQWIVDEENDYKVTYKHRGYNQREFYRWLNRMYHEGILDPDFATQTHQDYLAKIKSGRVLGLLDEYWDYQDADRYLESMGRYDRTYAELPLSMNESMQSRARMNQEAPFGWGIGITVACKDPIRAIKFIDFLCSDEGQVLTHWGIEGENYFIDKSGRRYLTNEEINESYNDRNYEARTGIGRHVYPWPSYGCNSKDANGNSYTTNTKENTIAGYSEYEKEAAKVWGVELLSDIFPKETIDQGTQLYDPLYSTILPKEVQDIVKDLDAIAWPSLIHCIISDTDEFDDCWNKMQEDLISAGCEKAEKLLTDYIQEKVYPDRVK